MLLEESRNLLDKLWKSEASGIKIQDLAEIIKSCFCTVVSVLRLHCYKIFRRIPPPLPDVAGSNGQERGNILSLAHAGVLHSSMPEDIKGIIQRFTL